MRTGAVGKLRLVAIGALGAAGTFKWSWARRVEVRSLECRRFGFGMSYSFC